MADMSRIVTAVIAVTVSVIVLASVLAPTIADIMNLPAPDEWEGKAIVRR